MDSLMLFNIGTISILGLVIWYAYKQSKKEKEKGEIDDDVSKDTTGEEM